MAKKQKEYSQEELDLDYDALDKEIEEKKKQEEADKFEDYDDDLIDDDLGAYNDFFEGGGTPAMEKHKDLLRELTDFNDEIRDKINYWLGKTWNHVTEKYEDNPAIQPIMNEKGAFWCISFLRNYSKKTNIITDIDGPDYKYIRIDIIEVLWEEFAPVCEMYGVSEENLKRVCVELEHASLLVLMGAGGGKYNKMLTQSTQRNENVNYVENNREMQQRNRGSMLNNIKRKLLGGGN